MEYQPDYQPDTLSGRGQPSKLNQHGNFNILLGALAPLSPPGWTDAGRHLVAGLQLAVQATNKAGGISGRLIELVVRDTAADAGKAVAAVDELASIGVVALAGEYHSVVARAVAMRAETIGLPYLCSSAVLDELTVQPSAWVARLAPAQSRGWGIYADFLHSSGRTDVCLAIDPSSIYWRSGSQILTKRMSVLGGNVMEYDVRSMSPSALCDELVKHEGRKTAVLLLAGFPDPVSTIATAIRGDLRLSDVMLGTPAGQAEFREWAMRLSESDGVSVPFLRYLPENLTPEGSDVKVALREKLDEEPSFVAFEGYDTIKVLADMLRTRGLGQNGDNPLWSQVDVNGTRGRITFSRVPGIHVWQWAWPPVQVAEREHIDRGGLRIRYSHSNSHE